MHHTLVSIAKLEDVGCRITSERGTCSIYRPSGEKVAQIPCMNGLYGVQNHTDLALLSESKITLQQIHFTDN